MEMKTAIKISMLVFSAQMDGTLFMIIVKKDITHKLIHIHNRLMIFKLQIYHMLILKMLIHHILID